MFDEIVAGLKRDRILTHADTTPPLRAQEPTEYEQLSMFGRERQSVVERVAAIKRAGNSRPSLTAQEKGREPEL